MRTNSRAVLRHQVNGWFVFTVIGTVMLIHDHIVTFSHERRFIWTAPRSMAKYAFLINRYIVPVGLFLALVGALVLSHLFHFFSSEIIEMCGFSGVRLSNVVRVPRSTNSHFHSDTMDSGMPFFDVGPGCLVYFFHRRSEPACPAEGHRPLGWQQG